MEVSLRAAQNRFLRNKEKGFLFLLERPGNTYGVSRQKSFTLVVIPGLTRNPLFSIWIPASARMTASALMQRSIGCTALAIDAM